MRFRYDLRKIDGLVTRDIPNLIELHFHVSQELLNDFRIAVDEEAEQIKGKFSTAIVLYNRDQIMKQYFTYHQQSLIRLSAELVRFNTASFGTSAAEYGILCNHLIDTIEKLLVFISRQYSKFTDFNTWLPSSYRLFALQQARTNLSALEKRMLQLNASQKLINLVMLPFRQFLVIGTTDEATYGKVYFLKALYEEIIYLTSAERSDISAVIQQRLVYLNYNSPAFFEFYTQQLTHDYRSQEHLADQLKRLAELQVSLTQLPVKQGVSFDSAQRSIKEELLDWIIQETSLLETRIDIIARMTEEEVEGFTTPESSRSFKFKINASVAQLAYIVRLLIETSILETTSLGPLLKSIARIFQTKRSGNIGEGSFSRRYYNVETGVRRAVRKMFLRMVDHIDRTEGIA